MSEENRVEQETKILFDMVRQRFAQYLEEGEMEFLKSRVKEVAGEVQALRAVSLRNSDEPFLTFTPYRKEG